MPDLPITGLPPIAAPLTGAEPLPVVQGGITSRADMDEVRTLMVEQKHAMILAPINIAPLQMGWLISLNSATADATLSLTAAAFGPVFNVIIKNIYTAPLTVTPQAGDTIDGKSGAYTLLPNDSIRIVSDGVTNFEIVSAVGSDVGSRTLTDIPNGYTLVSGDLDAILQMTGAGPTNAVQMDASSTASALGRGWTVTIKANEFPLALAPFGTDTIEGVPSGDDYNIPANSSVTITSDGTSNFIVVVDGTQRLEKAVTHLAQAANFTFNGLFSVAQVSTTAPGLKAILQVVGGYENDRFIAGDRAQIKNVGANSFDLTTNGEVLIKTIGAGEVAELVCLTVPGVAGDGTWDATIINADSTSNRKKWIPSAELNISGSDGADRRTFPAGVDEVIYFPASENRACRTSIQIPADYEGLPVSLNIQAYISPEVASVGKNTRLQLQYSVVRANNSETIGGAGTTNISTQAVPATANEFITGTIYSFTVAGAAAGDILRIKFARIGTDVLDTYTEGGIQLTGLAFSY